MYLKAYRGDSVAAEWRFLLIRGSLLVWQSRNTVTNDHLIFFFSSAESNIFQIYHQRIFDSHSDPETVTDEDLALGSQRCSSTLGQTIDPRCHRTTAPQAFPGHICAPDVVFRRQGISRSCSWLENLDRNRALQPSERSRERGRSPPRDRTPQVHYHTYRRTEKYRPEVCGLILRQRNDWWWERPWNNCAKQDTSSEGHVQMRSLYLLKSIVLEGWGTLGNHNIVKYCQGLELSIYQP